MRTLNEVPRTEPPPNELDEVVPNTLTEFDDCESLAAPGIPHISDQDSGVGTDSPSRELAAGAGRTIPDDNPELAIDWISMWNFANVEPGVSGKRHSAVEPLSAISRSSTMPVELDHSHTAHQEDELTSRRRSSQWLQLLAGIIWGFFLCIIIYLYHVVSNWWNF
ncbi:hypothetical protein L211DRAFT_847135 [Terfezia boudieri ATCC MYA-4762]|uniref:Uncharacterized protein n=1 Tax=Terfezia boudieri ATCC MYA-4762 TaxID=1051890 RepID=A0A3N4LY36_9PEZI|nr:hypothetical protein L211DRAFT_847135 [Terfezia boudieri ATCC MYA-4762]